MLAHHPRLKGREEERGSDAAEHAPEHEDPVVPRVLGHAREEIKHAIKLTEPLAAELVCCGACKGAKHHRGAEAPNEEHGDVMLREAVRRVQRVHVRSLQPVSRHAHVVHDEVDELEALEIGRHRTTRTLVGAGARLDREDEGDERASEQRGVVEVELHELLVGDAFRRAAARTSSMLRWRDRRRDS